MTRKILAAATLASVGITGISASAIADSIPSVVVTVENSAPSRGAVQTPVWIGIHDGSFDIYDRDVPLGSGSLISAEVVERLAEDGTTGPITGEFSNLQPLSPQATLLGASGPLVPGERSSTTLNVDPANDRFFSYASMVIPSNDAFIANGNPQAHPLFNEAGQFVGQDFAVTGAEVLDAGTEVNDEIAANTAFLNQSGPDIGQTEGGNVVLHEGFATEGAAYPDRVLSHPVFAAANFLAPTYRAASVSFRFVDLGRPTFFTARLTNEAEVAADLVVANSEGSAIAVARQGNRVRIRINTRRLSGPIVMAHLHNAAEGVNGPVVVNLTDDVINGRRVISTINASDVIGPLAENEDPFQALLNEMAAGNIYVNIHTQANPAGELRGQVGLR